jgi:hypothetical protein
MNGIQSPHTQHVALNCKQIDLAGAYRVRSVGCSGRKRMSVLENVLGHTMSYTITVLNSYQERQPSQGLASLLTHSIQPLQEKNLFVKPTEL